MKSLKSKVIASLAMLVVAAVMMTSSSFAWYTISTQGDVEKIGAKIEAANNLEIAKADKGTETVEEVKAGQTGTETYWGSSVKTFTQQTLDAPAAINGTTLGTLSYGTDGRGSAVGTGTEGAISGGQSVITDNGKKCAAVYTVYLRSNAAGDIKAKISNTPTMGKAKVAAQLGDGAITEISTTGATIGKITANTQTTAKIYVYFDGATYVAADKAGGGEVKDINVSFTK